LRGGAGVRIRYKGKILSPSGTTIGKIKLYIQEKEGIPIKKQRLTYNGKELDNGELLPQSS
jgi:hypothetical protein